MFWLTIRFTCRFEIACAAVFKIVRTYVLLTVSTRSYAVLVVICRRIRVQQDALSDRWVQRWQWGHSSFPGRTSPMIEQFRYRRTEIEPINKAFCQNLKYNYIYSSEIASFQTHSQFVSFLLFFFSLHYSRDVSQLKKIKLNYANLIDRLCAFQNSLEFSMGSGMKSMFDQIL